MESQVLDIENREPVRLQDFYHLLQRGDVGAGEDLALDPHAHRLALGAADRVDQPAAVRLQASLDQVGEHSEVALADVLEHSHRHERVVASRDVPVVVLDEFDAALQAAAPGRLSRVADLLLRQVERAHHDAVVLGHVQCERAPAAAHLDDGLAGPQAIPRSTPSGRPG